MIRYNLIAVMVLTAVLPCAAAGQEPDTAVSVAAAPVALKVPDGFSFQDGILILPNGQKIQNVTGVQEVGNFVLIVSPKKAGAYNKGRNTCMPLSLATPQSAPRALLTADVYQLALLPFDETKSSDKTADSECAFVSFAGAEKTVFGVYRYRAGQTALEFLPVYGGKSNFLGEFKSWYTFERDVVGQARKHVIRIDLDSTPEFRWHYYVKRMMGRNWGGKDALKGVQPPTRAHLKRQSDNLNELSRQAGVPLPDADNN